MLERGFNDLGIAALLDATGIPKGSFYHYFKSKEDFGLQVIDLYMVQVHAGLDHCRGDVAVPPLDRVRRFFELSLEKYRTEGYFGCLLGGLGQELSGVSEEVGPHRARSRSATRIHVLASWPGAFTAPSDSSSFDGTPRS